MMPQSDALDMIADGLRQHGWQLIADFLPAGEVRALAQECRALAAAAALTPAATGRGQGRQLGGLRGDSTRWLDADAPSAAQIPYWETMTRLRRGLNSRLLLGLESLEAHYALYPPGAGYARHRDRFRDDDARVLSSVLYLNEDWTAADGGALRLYLDEGERDVLPCGGTLALFLSAEVEHAVLPARRERLSIAGWLRRREGPF